MGAERDATVFEIREMTLHDGPGVRVTVFLKGCPLNCVWCHNPEGKSPLPQLMVKNALCRRCGMCTKDRDTEFFRRFGRNPDACPEGLISLCGRRMSPEELAERILPLAELLRASDGGVTFSGGEPMLYPGFIEAAAQIFRHAGLSVAVETCGYATAEIFRSVVSVCDYVMMDLKLFDSDQHEKYTGKPNGQILRNAEWLMKSGIPVEFRTPMIPGITDTPENLNAIERFVGASKWVRLPENKLARAKDDMLVSEIH